MAACSLGTADFKVSSLNFSRVKVSALRPSNLRNWISRRPRQFSSLVVSHWSRKSLRICCGTSSETETITRSETDSKETKYSNLESQLIPNLDEVENLLTNICDTTSIAEFQLKLKGFELRVIRGLSSEDLPPPAIPAPIDQSTSSAHSDTNGSVKTTSLAMYKPEPISSSSSSSKGVLKILDRAADEGIAILQSPKVGLFRRSRTIKGKRAPPPCKEKQIVKEGQVLCYIEQLGGEIPIESDVSGEVIEILQKDGEPVGYGDALIAILPSFPGIK